MATFRKRKSRWTVQIRKSGYPTICKTFSHKTDAQKWAVETERQIEIGEYVPADLADLDTLGGLLVQHGNVISIKKRGREAEIFRLTKMRRHKVAAVPLGKLTAFHIAQYRDDRLQHVSTTTVKKELQLISHSLDVGRREWGLSVKNVAADVSKPVEPKGRDRRLELGEKQASVGTTTFRPPFAPVSFGAIGGSERGPLIIPARTTPITTWNIENGAAMDEAGANFRRPFFFPRPGEAMEDAVAREATAVRTSCGIYDGTPLGTFELQGPDTGELLNRLYTNRFDNLPVGRGRFGLMLREDGRLFDDGVTFRVDENRYLMSCGTGAAGAVYAHIDRLLQTEWTDLNVYLVNVSAAWATMCVCGPLARAVLGKLESDIVLDPTFRFLDFRDGTLEGINVRVARVSYTGELSFEVNVVRRSALKLWKILMEAGKEFDITPVGSETSGVLRIEKGFISPGHEGDNITNPFDAGMGWIVDMTKPDFIGKRSLLRDIKLGGERQHVVGLLPDDEQALVADGSALLPAQGSDSRSGFQGHVTAACFSPTLKRTIALALLKDGQRRHGERVVISGLENSCVATVTEPVFYDPKGERMRG